MTFDPADGQMADTPQKGIGKSLKCLSLLDEQQYEYGEDLGITAVALYDYQAGEDSHLNISNCSDPEICRHQKHHVEIRNTSLKDVCSTYVLRTTQLTHV